MWAINIARVKRFNDTLAATMQINREVTNASLVSALSSGLVLALGTYSLTAQSTSGTKQIATLDERELNPGGKATTRRAIKSRNAFSQSSHGMSLAGEARFKIGNAIFRRIWVSAPASTKSSDGLGPLFNARACQHCHIKDGRGHPPEANWPKDDQVSMLFRISVSPQTDEQVQLRKDRRLKVVPEPTYGEQIQDLAIQGHKAEAHVDITYEKIPVTFADGETVWLRKPEYKFRDLAYGPLAPDTMISPRIAPQMIGLGLLEAIPENEIRKNADPDDKNQDGISGRVNTVRSLVDKTLQLGRFGWKAGTTTLKEQAAAAFAGDIGLSTPIVDLPAGDCTKSQQRCLNAPHGDQPGEKSYEVNGELLDLVTFYTQNLAVPVRRNAQDPQVLKGKALFNKTGCATCHHPTHVTGEVEGQPHLSHQVIWPYTDLLLHDMGPGLADNRPEGDATGREWRTPPLWGVGLTKRVSGHTYFLHDGRARNVEEAVLWHDGEASAARKAFMSLSKDDREALLKFVKSL